MLERRQLVDLLKRYRRLIVQYLEWNQTNLTIARFILQLCERLQAYFDLRDLVSFKDAKFREALGLIPKKVLTPPSHSRTPYFNAKLFTLEEAEHFFKEAENFYHYLEQFYNTLAHRWENTQIFEHQLEKAEATLQQQTAEQMNQKKYLTVLNELKKNATGLFNEYKGQAQQLNEFRVRLQAFHAHMQHLIHLVPEHNFEEDIHFLNLQHVDKMLEREKTQLVFSWRHLEELEHELEVEYVQEDEIHHKQEKLEQEKAPAISPSVTFTPTNRSEENPESS